VDRRRPRLRTVLLAVHVLILLLPLGGIAALRLYENELIRGTEAQLLAQGLVVRELYRAEYLRAAPAPVLPGAPPSAASSIRENEVLAPLLDASRDAVLPPAPPAAAPRTPPDPVAASAGAAMATVLATTARSTLAGVRVVDRAGIVVATSGTEMGMSLADREEVTRALAGERVSLLRRRISDEPAPPLRSISRGQRYRVFVAMPVREDGRILGAVVASRTPLDIWKALYLNRGAILVGAAAILAVVVAVSILTSLTIARPTRVLIEQAGRVARGERASVAGIGPLGTAEMAQLSEAIAGMAATLQDRADYIRTFASHVSHEFKTPLTTIRGTVELLEDHLGTMTPDERARFLAIARDAADRLDHLVRRLLDLARADVLAPGDETTGVAAALERLARERGDAGLRVRVRCEPGTGAVRMSADTLAEILGNLVENARVHGGDGVTVDVVARLDREANPPRVAISVEDDGPGVSEANADKIFTPFFTTARERGGSGLGLSIVRSLLAAHGGTIRLERSARGARFVVRIPASLTPGA
jgi:signal transduction histidine kinase